MMSLVGTWMGDCSSCCLSAATNPLSWLDLITGCWLCIDVELAIGECRLEQHLGPPTDDVKLGWKSQKSSQVTPCGPAG